MVNLSTRERPDVVCPVSGFFKNVYLFLCFQVSVAFDVIPFLPFSFAVTLAVSYHFGKVDFPSLSPRHQTGGILPRKATNLVASSPSVRRNRETCLPGLHDSKPPMYSGNPDALPLKSSLSPSRFPFQLMSVIPMLLILFSTEVTVVTAHRFGQIYFPSLFWSLLYSE